VEPVLTGAGSVRHRDRMQEHGVNAYGDRGYHPISNVLSIRMRMGRSSALKQHLEKLYTRAASNATSGADAWLHAIIGRYGTEPIRRPSAPSRPIHCDAAKRIGSVGAAVAKPASGTGNRAPRPAPTARSGRASTRSQAGFQGESWSRGFQIYRGNGKELGASSSCRQPRGRHSVFRRSGCLIWKKDRSEGLARPVRQPPVIPGSPPAGSGS